MKRAASHTSLEKSTSYRDQNAALFKKLNRCCVILDDDPTGNQTVYDVSILMTWDAPTIVEEFKAHTPVFFINTNSRSLHGKAVFEMYKEIAQNLTTASKETNRNFFIICRSDSTLRGHFMEETDAIAAVLKSKNHINMFIPALFEAGRVTMNDIHYIHSERKLVPVAESKFAEDAVFGYSTSNLTAWIEEKSRGSILASDVRSINLEAIRNNTVQELQQQIEKFPRGIFCIINAENYTDLNKITNALLKTSLTGHEIRYRSSSSLLPAILGLAYKKILKPKYCINSTLKNGGLIIIGSHVPKTTAQLTHVLKYAQNYCCIELLIPELLQHNPEKYLNPIAKKIEDNLKNGKTTILYTERKQFLGSGINETLQIGQTISQTLVLLVKKITVTPKYYLTKGGITSHDIAVNALSVKKATVLGQISPGVPVWKLAKRTNFLHSDNTPLIVFPGNVGEKKTLYETIIKLENA